MPNIKQCSVIFCFIIALFVSPFVAARHCSSASKRGVHSCCHHKLHHCPPQQATSEQAKDGDILAKGKNVQVVEPNCTCSAQPVPPQTGLNEQGFSQQNNLYALAATNDNLASILWVGQEVIFIPDQMRSTTNFNSTKPSRAPPLFVANKLPIK